MQKSECNLCGNTEFRKLFKTQGNEQGVGFFPSSDVIGNDLIVKCPRCGLVFVNPLPDEKNMIEEYSNFKDERFASQSKGREITFARNLKDIEKFKKRGSLLDVGTANGSFLYTARKNGWDVDGVELNKYLINWAKENYQLNIKQGTIFQNKFQKKFDVVTLWDVLEHVSDPTKTLAKCNELMKDDGILIVNYPDYRSRVATLLGKKWPFYLRVHLYYFDRKTIVKMLDKCGFKVLKIKPHIQYLDLGYIFFRAKRYIGMPASIAISIINFLGLKNKKVPYNIGQTLVIAKKKTNVY
ncbi:MAG: class I SAM-dependent methyltransferase [archaeon]|nr:class I SAM-dependent methyltransferase [archaeon]